MLTGRLNLTHWVFCLSPHNRTAFVCFVLFCCQVYPTPTPAPDRQKSNLSVWLSSFTGYRGDDSSLWAYCSSPPFTAVLLRRRHFHSKILPSAPRGRMERLTPSALLTVAMEIPLLPDCCHGNAPREVLSWPCSSSGFGPRLTNSDHCRLSAYQHAAAVPYSSVPSLPITSTCGTPISALAPPPATPLSVEPLGVPDALMKSV